LEFAASAFRRVLGVSCRALWHAVDDDAVFAMSRLLQLNFSVDVDCI